MQVTQNTRTTPVKNEASDAIRLFQVALAWFILTEVGMIVRSMTVA
jgi:hypothetical protein